MKQQLKQNSLPLYQLIAVLDDAKKGYLLASEKIKDEVLSLLMERFGYQRGRYSYELQQLLSNAGTSSPIDRATLGFLYRTWMDLKTTFKTGQKDTIIKGCIKAEETTLKNYNLALEQVRDNAEVSMILQQQANGIKTGLKTIMEYTGKINN